MEREIDSVIKESGREKEKKREIESVERGFKTKKNPTPKWKEENRMRQRPRKKRDIRKTKDKGQEN